MKKIININFHGRVVPIEETAYDILKQYVESLRKHFANEEGRDEIINDIENRFAELFSERLQKGSTCITDADVNAIINSMGRPEDFEKDDITAGSGASQEQGQQKNYQQSQSQYSFDSRQLYRSENDKVLGGVCAGIANYLKVDPAIVRIIFALITFGGFGLGILIYIILWVVLPPKSLALNVRKRLYRNPENRVIGGVASGLAAYFHIEVWIPRLIFALPLILGVVTSIFRNRWFDLDPAPVFVTGGFGGTLFITYIILWIVLPEAVTASEKLEMRGEKVDLESIKNTIKSDLEGFRGRAATMGSEIKERAQQFGQEMKEATQNFSSEAGPAIRKTGTGFGHAIGVLFKAFFLFIASIVSFALITALIGLFFTGAGVLPLRHYLLSGFWQNFFGWSTLFLFLAVPIIGLLTWLVRRIIGVRSRNNYLGYVFGTLWTLGWISLVIFASMVFGNFRSRTSVEDPVSIVQPSTSRMIIKTNEEKVNYYGMDWFGLNWEDRGHFFGLNEDSVMMTTVRINVTKSSDSGYHVQKIRSSYGNTPSVARQLANEIQFDIAQNDSFLYLPQGFAITPEEKFRNQQVLIVIQVPLGKKIMLDNSVENYRWFNMNINRRHWNWEDDGDDYWRNGNRLSTGVEYIMTENGAERTLRFRDNSEQEEGGRSNAKPKEGYRYRGGDSMIPKKKKDSIHVKVQTEQKVPAAEKQQKEEVKSSAGLDPIKKLREQEYPFTPVISSIYM